MRITSASVTRAALRLRTVAATSASVCTIISSSRNLANLVPPMVRYFLDTSLSFLLLLFFFMKFKLSVCLLHQMKKEVIMPL